MISPEEYRTIVVRQQGRRPPCLKCRDKKLLFCMKTGFECREFSSFAAEHRTKEVERRASKGHCRSRNMKHVRRKENEEQCALGIRMSFIHQLTLHN